MGLIYCVASPVLLPYVEQAAADMTFPSQDGAGHMAKPYLFFIGELQRQEITV